MNKAMAVKAVEVLSSCPESTYAAKVAMETRYGVASQTAEENICQTTYLEWSEDAASTCEES